MVRHRHPLSVRAYVVLACSIAIALRAHVAAASPSARLVYARSPEAMSCPDESALRKAVAARFGYDPFFPWAKRTVVVQVFREGRRLRSRVQLVTEDGVARGTRQLASDADGDACGALFDATALAMAIALDTTDPSAATSDAAEDDGGHEREAASEPTSEAARPSPPPEAPRNAAEGGDRPAMPARPDIAPGTRRSAPAWSLGVDAAGWIGTAPAPALGGSVFGEGRLGLASLAVELTGNASLSKHVGSSGDTVQTSITAGALVPCVHLAWAFACGVGEAGELVAWSEARREGRAFGALGGRLGLEIPVSTGLRLRVRADALADVRRRTFAVSGGETWQMPSVIGAAAVGAAFRLP